jgi:isopropylmalate/homocitrate/citramalate synthase
MFFWWDTKKIEEFSQALVAGLADRFPPSAEGKGDNAATAAEALAAFYAKADRFGRENRMGIYKKAKLANEVKWRMKELGYSADLAEKVSKTLAIRLATRSGKTG